MFNKQERRYWHFFCPYMHLLSKKHHPEKVNILLMMILNILHLLPLLLVNSEKYSFLRFFKKIPIINPLPENAFEKKGEGYF